MGKLGIDWRVLVLGALLCAVAAAATPYVTLKLGMSIDLTFGGMFLASYLLAHRYKEKGALAVQLNIIQTMIGVVSGIGFMVVILSAFFYLTNVFGRTDVVFDPEWWQMFLWLTASAILGVFMGILPRKMILRDKTLPWPTPKATLSVVKTLSDPDAAEKLGLRRMVLMMSTAASGFGTFVRDGLGVIPPLVGNSALSVTLGLEFMSLGVGLLIPLSVGLSGLLGAWGINVFGEQVAQYSALAGTAPEFWNQCHATLQGVAALGGAERDAAMGFLSASCGQAAEFVTSDSLFKFVVQWMMWPATAMMIAAALTSVIVSVVRNMLAKRRGVAEDSVHSLADEDIPAWWTATGIAVSATVVIWMTSVWFDVSWVEVVAAVALQTVLIVAGLRVLAITGSGPVSLMANATQFLFGLLWPGQIRSNLVAAYVSANPQASSESAVPAFWVAQRVGGRFRTLIVAMLIMIPIGALLTPVMFNLLEKTYGIGPDPGQLSAPTGLKIASLAMVMERGVSALPFGALTASIIAIVVGIAFELLLAVQRTNAKGEEESRFPWVPVPSALGFALILPPSLTISMAIGSVVSAIWRKFSPGEEGTPQEGSYAALMQPLAAGLIAGEAMVGAILLPAVFVLLELLRAL